MNNRLHHNIMHHYNTRGHAHELTFSCYHRYPYFNDPVACKMFLEDVEKSRGIYNFRLWAYILMLNHVHILLWPLNSNYDIGEIESGMKGIMAKRYRKYLLKSNNKKHDLFLITNWDKKQFIFRQKGGGFDRNLWNTKAINDSIAYIEANPVRAHLVTSPEKWQWSSSYAGALGTGVVPDNFALPVAMPNPQHQRSDNRTLL